MGALEKFDRMRANALRNAEAQQQKELNHQKEADMRDHAKASNEESHLEGKIGQEKAQLKAMKDNFMFKLTGLEGEIAELQEMVNAEAALDEKRVNQEKTEAKDSESHE